MKCKNCGCDLDSNSKFCGFCGTKVEDVKVAPILENESISSGVGNVDVKDSISVDSTSLEVSNNQVEYNVEPIKSGKKVGIIIVLLVIISLLLGGVYFYLKSSNSTSKIVKEMINSVYDKLDFDTVSSVNLEKESLYLTGNLVFNTNISELSILDGEKVDYRFGIDYPNKMIEMGATLDENGNKIIDGDIYLLSNQIYLSMKDTFDGIIKLGDYDFDEIFNLDFTSMNYSKDDIKYVLNAYKNILIDSLDMDDFKKSSDTIELGGKDVSVTRISYELTEQRLNTLSSKISDGVLNDSELLEKLSKMFNVSVDYLKMSFENKSADANYLNGSSIRFDIYTKGFNNTFVGMDINGMIKIRKNDDVTSINIGIASQSINIVITKKSDSEYNIVMTSNIQGKDIKVDMNILSNKVDNKVSNGSLSLNVTIDGNTIGIKNNFNVSIGSKISNIDISTAKDVSNMDEEELKNIEDVLMSKITDSNIYNFINGMVETFKQSKSQELIYE